ncbi:MAG TPA: TIGR03560 family F420-dependent LLM class oxidoreductase [Thermoanaerobaculia bacterium]|nr:TIGR03560 family F420-dependent LLM class oxidoreductase [Thermoanaerobaculia bacterium]
MRFSYWPAPTHSWQDTLEVARHCERTGWDGIWYADHFMPNEADTLKPWHECWTTLAALAAVVPRVRIGPLVSGNTYRHPAVLAKMAVTLDHVSGGRAVLGLGAGWQENEHRAYGIEYSDVPGRLRRLDEACQVIRSLLRQPKSDLSGQHYHLAGAPLEPKPVGKLPLLIGGGGEQVTLRIAAEHADEWNVWGDVATLRRKSGILERHCAALGRDAAQIARSAQALLFFADDEKALDAIRARPLPVPTLAGSPAQIQDTLAAYRAAGVDEWIVPGFNLGPLQRQVETLDRFQDEVAAGLR